MDLPRLLVLRIWGGAARFRALVRELDVAPTRPFDDPLDLLRYLDGDSPRRLPASPCESMLTPGDAAQVLRYDAPSRGPGRPGGAPNVQVVCLDLEGVLVPEIWIAFAERTGIDAFRRTTRDEPDYDKLMRERIG